MKTILIWLNFHKISQTQHKAEFSRLPGMMIIQIISTFIIEFMSNAMMSLFIHIDMVHIKSTRQTQRTTPILSPTL